MGCFLGCFGFTSNRKRRKSSKKILPRDQRLGSYRPLDSFLSEATEIESHEGKKQPGVKVKKKVSFNLNVQTYQPIPDAYGEDEDEDNKTEDQNKKKIENRSQQALASEERKAELRLYPSDYRYRDCVESYDEEDQIESEDSNLDEDEYYYSNDDDDHELFDIDERRTGQGEMRPKELDSDYKEAKSDCFGSSRNERIRPTSAVLNPVENLAQWKEIKAKGSRQQMKENIPPNSCDQSQPLLPKITVDASLSNWLFLTRKMYEQDILSRRSPSKKSPALGIMRA